MKKITAKAVRQFLADRYHPSDQVNVARLQVLAEQLAASPIRVQGARCVGRADQERLLLALELVGYSDIHQEAAGVSARRRQKWLGLGYRETRWTFFLSADQVLGVTPDDRWWKLTLYDAADDAAVLRKIEELGGAFVYVTYDHDEQWVVLMRLPENRGAA